MIATAFPVTVEEHMGVMVVRDDLLPGGTKIRALVPVMTDHPGEYVFASPAFGYAQIALAYAARMTGQTTTLFVADRAVLHRRTQEAERAGARLMRTRPGYLSVCQARARLYAREAGAHLLALGCDHPWVRSAMVRAIREAAASLPAPPDEVWSAAGAGMLSLALQEAFPNAARFYAVQVGKKLSQEHVGRAHLLVAPEEFSQPARGPLPPFPSCAEYDAKVWRFIRQSARGRALFWNVAH